MPVKLTKLNFRSLAELDEGKMELLLQYHLKRIAGDIEARRVDKKPRKMIIEFTATPVLDAEGDLRSINVQIEMKSKVPTHRSEVFAMRSVGGQLGFNQDFPDDPDQLPLFHKSDSDSESED